jgi:hypothetical protein
MQLISLNIAVGIISVAFWSVESVSIAQNNLMESEGQYDPAAATTILCPGEDLTYEVSWSFVKIGTIRLKMINQSGEGSNRRYIAKAYINSYPGLPFVNLHSVMETHLDKECFSDYYEVRERDGDRWNVVRYHFNRQAKSLLVERGVADSARGNDVRMETIDSVAIDDKSLEGLSLLYFSRANVKCGRQMTMPTIIDGKSGYTQFDFFGKSGSIKLDAVQYPVSVVQFNGDAKFSGIFGLTGPFKGWFSNDAAQIPIKAELKVILGSVNVELIRWNRAGWEPPRYTVQ